MKIGIVTYALEIGGVESVMLYLGKYFKNRGYSVDFIETYRKGNWSSYVSETEGFNVKTITIKWYQSWNQYFKLLKKELENYDILLINDSLYAVFVVPALNLDKKVFTILHNDLESMIFNATCCIESLDGVICVNKDLYNKLILEKCIDRDKVFFVANGIEIDSNFQLKQKKYDNVLHLLYFGRLENNQKGILYLPEIGQILKEKNILFNLDIIGDGPDFDLLKEKIKNLKLENNIKLLGRKNHNELLTIISKYHIFLMPSKYEGHPIALLEAMAYGIVPIVTNVNNAIEQTVKNGINGFLCDKQNVKKFSEKILFLHKNRNKLKDMSKEAYLTIKNNFSIEKMGEKYLQIFNKKNKVIRSKKMNIKINENKYLPIIFNKISRRIKRLF